MVWSQNDNGKPAPFDEGKQYISGSKVANVGIVDKDNLGFKGNLFSWPEQHCVH